MKKEQALNRWLWKWHMIAGLITLPIVLLLCVTGIIYLFKDDYNHYAYQPIITVKPQGQTKSIETQLDAVAAYTSSRVDKVKLPVSPEQATEFVLAGKGHVRTSVYVNPYTGTVTGEINGKETGMFTVRKLHGELLLSKPGTYVVELVASWFVVLLLTGIYIFWPGKDRGWRSFFSIRFNQGRRALYRDLHSVIGFWLSLFMLVIIAGGMPWTDIFGSNLKWMQKQTATGYPQHWHSSRGLTSQVGDTRLSLDQLISLAHAHQLPGQLTVTLPTSSEQVLSVSNRSLWLSDQQVLHFDQYSGELIKQLSWQDVGVLMDMRQVAMRLHQGQYGAISWWGVLIVTLLFALSTTAGLVSYLIRKPKGNLGMIRVPERFVVGRTVLIMILGLGILFPLFGGSALLLATTSWLLQKRRQSRLNKFALD